MKKLLYVTGSRAEYGIMKRLLAALKDHSDIELSIVATGMHCDEKYGNTYKVIEADGFEIAKLIDIQIDNSNNEKILNSMSICQSEFGKYFQENQFDAVMILGDRYEIFSVAIAAAMHNIPLIHLHGGEITLGNYDEFIRHSITKMSKLHLASTEEYRNRIIQMGENSDTVYNVGALGAENAMLLPLPDKKQLQQKFGVCDKPYFMVVFHPETLTGASITKQMDELLGALEEYTKRYNFLFIGSNSDTGSDQISSRVKTFCNKYNLLMLTSVRPEEYLALNKYSIGLIGNSSSGLIEIPSLGVPTINIGDRQRGRVRGDSVIDVRCCKDDIIDAIEYSQSNSFSLILSDSENPYFRSGVLNNALEKILGFLKDQAPLEIKEFYDIKF